MVVLGLLNFWILCEGSRTCETSVSLPMRGFELFQVVVRYLE